MKYRNVRRGHFAFADPATKIDDVGVGGLVQQLKGSINERVERDPHLRTVLPIVGVAWLTLIAFVPAAAALELLTCFFVAPILLWPNHAHGRRVPLAGVLGGVCAYALERLTAFALHAGSSALTDERTSTLRAAHWGKEQARLLLLVLVFAPIAEEVCFRGVGRWLLLTGRRRWWRYLTPLLVTVAFGLAHSYGLRERITVMASGAVFYLVRERTGSLGAAVAAHLVTNVLAVLVIVWG